ncbi:MAG TPA: regulatory protein RecX [Coriobacteriia bacterium]|nr:regulatory protein RecX [Coriobacteriia bacterium]
MTSAAVVRVLSLEVGDQVERDGLVEDLLRIGRECARDRVLRLLGYRDRTISELNKRLRDDGYADEIADGLVARFVELGYLDDEMFAQRWTAARRQAGFGPSRIERELRTKGIAQELARSAAYTSDDEELLASARSLISRIDLSDAAARKRAFAKLIRKGYSPTIAGRAIGSGGAEE